jgi:hypothetical protein
LAIGADSNGGRFDVGRTCVRTILTRATLLGADERLARRGSSRATGASTPVDRAILRSDRR